MPARFTSTDFDIFKMSGFSERMQAIRQHIRPKLIGLGEELTPWLEHETGLEFYYHVATHARRRVNPPNDTWVAFGRSARGYKRYIHLAVAIDCRGLRVEVVAKPESDDKYAFAEALIYLGSQGLANLVPYKDVTWYDDRKGDILLHQMGANEIQNRAAALRDRRSAGVAMGKDLSRGDVLGWESPKLLNELRKCLIELLPLYTLPLDLAVKI